MKITAFFIKNKKFTNLLMIFIIITGALSIITLPRQDSPNVDFNLLTITTFYPGASPDDVEINVTDKIEDELEKVDGIEEISSFSVESMSWVFVMIDSDSSDVSLIKEEIRNAVDRVSDFPPEVEEQPQIQEMRSTDFPIIELAIMGPDDQEMKLRKVARDLESAIKAVGKVGAIDKIGYRKREVKILTDLKKMEENHISFNELLLAIKNRNVKLSGGTLESFVDEKKIVTFSEFEKLDDVKDVIVRSNFSGKNIRVSDIAAIENSFEKRTILTSTNGINSINLIVKRRGTTDVIDLSRETTIKIKVLSSVRWWISPITPNHY